MSISPISPNDICVNLSHPSKALVSIRYTFSKPLIEFKFLQFLNDSSPISNKSPVIFIFSKLVQFLKSLFSITLMSVGKSISFKDLQFSNTPSSNIFKSCEKIILVNDSQFLNALFLINLTESGITILSNLVQLINASAPISSILFGIITFLNSLS